jgi:ABC-type branched-subunit amino acid transport system substrate-binding protein
MVTGGASPEEAHAMMDVAGDLEFVHMVGFVPGNTVTGDRCSRYAFQGMFNAKMAAQALAPVLVREYGAEQNMVQIQPDSDLGDSFAESVGAEMSQEANWHQLNTIQTRIGTQSYESSLQEAADLGPDVLVLNYYGLDGANALSQAEDIVPDDMNIVVPLFDRAMAAAAGGAIEGVFGTVNWESNIDEPASRGFNQAWMNASMGDQTATPTPSGVAHLAYWQLLQYAAAVERADSFHPDDVITQLEDHEYGTGMGTQQYRACDHQTIRSVPVVKGLSEQSQYPGTYFQHPIITEDIGYGCDEPPANQCTMG